MVHLYRHHHHHVLHGCVVMIAKSGAAYLLNLLMSLEKQDGLVWTMETRHLLTVLFHKKRQMLRSMRNLTFRMLQLMKQMMTDPTPKLAKHHHGHLLGQTCFCIGNAGHNPLMRNVKPQSSTPIDNEHILGVEGQLNNLLDGNGGISKRKDATNGYLKLLVVTAAEGDSAGGTSKSVRDLSLILDALLKTKSRSVLLDIINKNGLQMLHNILKQNRINFHRIPIIRKLLKVLEFLAQKGILTSEHINGGPRCAGVESFRDSMLSLVRHKNFQVQQIARSFRDRWILHNNARSEPTEYPHISAFAQDIQGTNMVWSSARRKCKSRWDYQPDEHYKMVGLKIQKVFSGHGEYGVRSKLQRNQGTNNCYNGVHHMESSTEGADDDVPPGFEPKQECQPSQLCMERNQPSLSVSHGVPVTLGQHFGTPESEGGQCHQKWKVAPGVPFSPCPPVPAYPRGSPCPSTSSSHMFQPDGTSPVNHSSYGNCGRTVGRDGRIGRGGMGLEQNGHTIIKEGNFRATIIDLKESSLQNLNSSDLGFRAAIGSLLQFLNLR